VIQALPDEAGALALAAGPPVAAIDARPPVSPSAFSAPLRRLVDPANHDRWVATATVLLAAVALQWRLAPEGVRRIPSGSWVPARWQPVVQRYAPRLPARWRRRRRRLPSAGWAPKLAARWRQAAKRARAVVTRMGARAEKLVRSRRH
jgi:hypothetical protein